MSRVNGNSLLLFLVWFNFNKVGQILLSPWLEAHLIFNEHLENCSREGRMGGSEISFPGVHENACGTNLPASFSLQFDREDFQKHLVGREYRLFKASSTCVPKSLQNV